MREGTGEAIPAAAGLRADARPAEPGVISWTTHPARANPARAAAVLGMIALVPLALQIFFADPFLTILGFLLLALPLVSWFFPTRVLLDDRGVTVRGVWGRRFRRWEAFRSFQHDARHVRLCPFRRPSRIDGFRGVLLRFGPGRNDALAYIRERIPSRSADATGD